MTTPTRATALVVSLLLVGGLAACADPVEGAAPTPTASATATATASGTPSSTAAQDIPLAGHNEVDTEFAQLMLLHHEGGVDMAGLAATNAGSPGVIDLAAAILAVQGPEIDTLTSWLDQWGEGVVDASTAAVHEGMLMDDLQHDEAMTELAWLTGPEFDARFLELMIAHHEGAVTMARTQIAGGVDDAAVELARTIVHDETVEITLMEGLLAAL